MPTRTASRRVDFGDLGSEAYPGRLANAWSAWLTEPPAVAELRASASPHLAPLGEVSPVKSGIPTRAVKYFALEELDDESLLREYGIITGRDRERLALVRDGRQILHVIERVSIQPLVRQPGNLEGRIFVAEEELGNHRLFYVHETEEDLRAQRRVKTLEYIDYGTHQDFAAPEASRRQGGIPSERAQVRIRPTWYAVPTMPSGSGRIVWPKGRGQTHYVAVIPERYLILDNFYYSEPDPSFQHPLILAAVANLSLTHVMVEIHGRRAAGDGVLHTYIRELNRLPIIDPRTLPSEGAEELVRLFRTLAERPQKPIAEELRERDRQEFDLCAMEIVFGGGRATEAAQVVERALRDLATERVVKAASGEVQRERSARRSRFDPDPIAARIVQDLPPPTSVLTQLGALAEGGLEAFTLTVPTHPPAEVVSRGTTLFDDSSVIVNGATLVAAPSPLHAELLVAALRSDPNVEGDVTLPHSRDEAERLVHEWEQKWDEWVVALREKIASALQGGQSQRRRQVLESAFRLANVLPPGS